MAKVLVVGGAGYIGSHVVKGLCQQDHDVVVFDNLSTGLPENVDKRVKLVKGDLLNVSDLKKVFDQEYDFVFHLAAKKAAGESMVNPAKYASNNISGTINLLNLMLENKVKNIIFSSSAAVYGSPQYLPVDEKHPLDPANFYGFTKLEIERIMHWYSQIKGLNFAALRYFNAVGYDIEGKIKGREKNPANLLPVVMEVATGQREKVLIFGNDYQTSKGKGSGVRDYIHVTDLMTAHLKAMEFISQAKNLIVNLGTGSGYSVLEVVEKAREVTGQEIPYEFVARRPGDPAELIASSDLAFKLLNWKAEHSDLNTILKTMWNGYKG